MLQNLGSPGGWTATVTLELAHIQREIGDLARSAQLASQSLRLAHEVGDRRGTAAALEGLAATLASAGAAAAAVRLIVAARKLRAETGAPIPPSESPGVRQILAASRNALGEAGFHRAESSTAVVSLDDIVAGALALASEAVPGDGHLETEASHVSERASSYGLTSRERDVLALLVEGHSNPEIAATLFISQKTVRNHLTSIFSKLGVESRTAAATLALRQGLA
jgi:DNA-binding CsgD family transcriptional regulator